MERNDFIKKKSIDLFNILKNKVKGTLFIGYENGTITVNINNARGFIHYKKYINDDRSLSNLERLADDIIYDYRKYLLSLFLL